ncbi:hypothetical protein GQX73_g9142 [Xylaria multiplex]|uniref:Ricin B lectin domain-containing protein n=1 Tax=Xylaria multiplex TaxID=323545 RepID=A0A7C8IIG7_9PEZI|nr:hypothetical protein GQX73_g9142 [Xylaria multiplex]
MDTPLYTGTDTASVHDKEGLPSFTANGGVGSVPEAEGIYMIRDLDSGRAITLDDGRLTLKSELGTRGGWQWRCKERPDGWIGFRDVIHGKYLGRDNKGGFYVRADKMDSWEWFVLRPREAGGYNLLVKNWSRLVAMAIADDEISPNIVKGETLPTLVEAGTAEEAARWEFIKVG